MEQLINNHWAAGRGQPLQALDPATGQVLAQGRGADGEQVRRAIEAACLALPQWSSRTFDQRLAYLLTYAQVLGNRQDELARQISSESGKPLWEAKAEVQSMINKVAISARAFKERRKEELRSQPVGRAVTRYKPHGVAAVLGPFNMPGHLPNGHIVPALLAGNTVVFKPSDKTPLCGAMIARCLLAADLPAGVFNLVQGGGDVGEALARDSDVDGVFFTGGTATGLGLRRLLAEQVDKVLALEMGGNNPLVVVGVEDVKAAAYLTVLSAYLTAGQRCSCARRLIVVEGAGSGQFLSTLLEMIAGLRVGPFTLEPEPFMGPVIRAEVAQRLLAAQNDMVRQGGRLLEPMAPCADSPAMLRPGLIDVSGVTLRQDTELFGPLLQLIRVPDFHAALVEANNTAYGLCAGLLSDDPLLYEQFYGRVRAGVINWNRQTTGASSELPFGGVGLSGNHRPSGYFAADYCSYPVASLEEGRVSLPDKLLPGVTL